jgi:hypothetical protein
LIFQNTNWSTIFTIIATTKHSPIVFKTFCKRSATSIQSQTT